MSLKCLLWAWEIEGLTPIQKLVLVRLADQAHDDGICWPGKKYLARYCCTKSKRTIDAAIKSLVAFGLVRVKTRRQAEGGNDTNVYELQITQRDLFAGLGGGADIAPHGASDAPRGGANGGALNAPKPLNRKNRTVPKKPSAADFSDWEPAAAIIERIKTMRPGITDEFLAEILPEFITYAEGHWRRDQLDSKFISNANRQWFRKINKHKQGPPKDEKALMKWAESNDAPPLRRAETTFEYHQRLWDWVNAGRPETPPPPSDSPTIAGAGLLDDMMGDEIARQMETTSPDSDA